MDKVVSMLSELIYTVYTYQNNHTINMQGFFYVIFLKAQIKLKGKREVT